MCVCFLILHNMRDMSKSSLLWKCIIVSASEHSDLHKKVHFLGSKLAHWLKQQAVQPRMNKQLSKQMIDYHYAAYFSKQFFNS